MDRITAQRMFRVFRAAGILAICLAICGGSVAHSAGPPARLAVVWVSGDAEVAHRACLMYTHNAKTRKWFDEVTLIVWGPSARLLAADKELQAKVRAMAADGVRLEACQACADGYGVSDQLRKLGVDVRYMGQPLSEMLKQDWKVLTF
jgi:hypothetical protein